jgi:hypothetical protein
MTKTEKIKEYFLKVQPERDILETAEADLDKLFNDINELVERRNEIAHGVIDADNLQTADLLKERCHFVHAFGNALYNILIEEALRYHIKLQSVQPLGKPFKIFGDSILCFRSDNCIISTGCTIVAKTKDNLKPFIYGTIISIQINNISHQQLSISNQTEFSVKVSFKGKEQYAYYILPENLI